ncbi:MAG: hypothetical protein ACI8TQ_002382 [Planctomycetota bacterium]|jgi:hypothetical protein
MGTIPVSGSLLRSFAINELGLGIDGVALDLQGIQFFAGAQGLRLSAANPSSVEPVETQPEQRPSGGSIR